MAGPLNFLNLNNNALTGLMQNNFMSAPGTLGFGTVSNIPMFPSALDTTCMGIDTFCTTMLMNQEKMQQQFISALLEVLSNMKINHVPENWVFDNVRPYDYNKYGNDGDKISKLDPAMQQKTMQLLDWAKSQGMQVKITSGYRTPEEQAALCKKTDNAVANSPHTRGKAVDLEIINGTDEDYKKLGDYAKSIGMRWGGDFKDPKPERWHFDYGWR